MELIDQFKESFKEKLNDKMEELGISKNQLAKEIGCSRAVFTKYTNGETCPSLPVFLSICKVLDVDTNYFLNGDDSIFSYYDNVETIITSLCYLMNQNVLQFDDKSKTVRINPSMSSIKEVLKEFKLYNNSRLVHEMNVAKAIVEKYKEDVYNDIYGPDLPF